MRSLSTSRRKREDKKKRNFLPGPAGAASLAAPLASGAAGPADGLLLGARALLAVALLAAGGAAALAVGCVFGFVCVVEKEREK